MRSREGGRERKGGTDQSLPALFFCPLFFPFSLFLVSRAVIEKRAGGKATPTRESKRWREKQKAAR
jgi:hypothetical protein